MAYTLIIRRSGVELACRSSSLYLYTTSAPDVVLPSCTHDRHALRAACAWLIYDICLCLEKEITYVWPSRRSLPKYLYFFIRYFGLPLHIFSCIIGLYNENGSFCDIYNLFNTVWLFIAAAAGDALLMLRVLAILKDKRAYTITVKVIYGVVYGIETGLVLYYLAQQPNPNGQSNLANAGCTDFYTGQTSPGLSELILPIATGPILFFNIFLLVIVVMKTLPQYRSTRDITTPIVTLILRDGVMYFVAICCGLVFVTVTPIALWSQPTMSMMSLGIFIAASPVASGRLFLHLREIAGQPAIVEAASALEATEEKSSGPLLDSGWAEAHAGL